MSEIPWEALNQEQRRQLYPRLIRQVFAPGGPAAELVAPAILPAAQGPESVQIEITTWCNLKCRECGRTKMTALGTWVNGHIALDTYAATLEKLPAAKRIILQGVGEPTMHPQFTELVRLAAESGKFERIVFNTNGHTHKDDFWVNLAQRYPCAVSLSVDSLDPVIAERCRSGTDAELLFARLALFRQIFSGFYVTLVASKMNLHDIAATIDKMASLGPGTLAIQSVITDDAEIALDDRDAATLHATIAHAAATTPHLRVQWEFTSTGLRRCVAPFLAPFVTVEGYLTPCCVLIEPSAYGWTSLIGDQSWEQATASPGVMNWTQSYLREDPAPCRACPFNPAREGDTRPASADHFASKARPEAATAE